MSTVSDLSRLRIFGDIAKASTAGLVKEGLDIRGTIETYSEMLDILEKELRRRALEASAAGEVEALTDSKLEGTQWLAKGDEATVPVVITSDAIVGSFADGSPAHKRLAEIAGDKLHEFFRPAKTW